MAKNEMTTSEAVLILKMVDVILATSVLEKDQSKQVLMLTGKVHDAVDLACTALMLMGNNTIEIDKEGD